MEIKKGQILQIHHSRKGKFEAMAKEDFNTKSTEFYPVVLVTPKVKGMVNDWVTGEEIPCRGSLCTVEVIQ